MKSNEVLDYKRNLKKLNNSTKLVEFKFAHSEEQTIEKLDFHSGIAALLGRNGAGKSSVLRHINSLIHNKFSTEQRPFVETSLKILFNGQEKVINLSASVFSSFENIEEFRDRFLFLNYADLQTRIVSLLTQPNSADITVGLERVELTSNELEEISFLVGNKYQKVEFCEVEEYIDDIGDAFPFFEVQASDNSGYTTIEMGQGERILFHYWWKFHKGVERNSIILIEEPETFLFPGSQKNLSNFLIKKAVDLKLNIIISTHSSYFYKAVNKRVLLQQLNANIVGTEIPKHDYIDKLLDLEIFPRNLILVEDRAAQFIFNTLFGKYDQSILAEWQVYGAIVSYDQLRSLSINFDLSQLNRKTLVGVDAKEFDEKFIPLATEKKDQFTIINSSCIQNKKGISVIKIPGKINPDEDIRQIVCSNFSEFCSILGVDSDKYLPFKGAIQVIDAHDWLAKAEEIFGIGKAQIFSAGCQLFSSDEIIKTQMANISTFLEDLVTA